MRVTFAIYRKQAFFQQTGGEKSYNNQTYPVESVVISGAIRDRNVSEIHDPILIIFQPHTVGQLSGLLDYRDDTTPYFFLSVFFSLPS